MACRGPGYIAIEGPIGVGKNHLRDTSAQIYYWSVLRRTPFSRVSTRPQSKRRCRTQLFFLFQRPRRAQTARQRSIALIRVADVLLEKDRIFAELTNPDELELYYLVYELLAPRSRPRIQSFICRDP